MPIFSKNPLKFALHPESASGGGLLYPCLCSPIGRENPIYLMHDGDIGTVLVEDQDIPPEDRTEKTGDRIVGMAKTHLLQPWYGDLELIQEG